MNSKQNASPISIVRNTQVVQGLNGSAKNDPNTPKRQYYGGIGFGGNN